MSEDPADPIAYFLEDLTYHGRSERTRRYYEQVLRRFERFISDPDVNPFESSFDPGEVTHRHCLAFVHSLRSSVSGSTVATYATYLHRFYSYMTEVGVFESNPMTLVMEELDESVDRDPTRREIDLPTMRAFVSEIRHPLEQALIVTLLKTGVRAGELCNLDSRDVHLSTAQSALGVEPRAALQGRPDSLYVPAEPTRGSIYNGEPRTASNKRKRATVIPVDDELRTVLTRYLAVRPDTASPALFVKTSEGWGERLTPEALRHVVTTHASEYGWHRRGGNREENVTPHYFRHFFTTHLRDRTGDRGIVKYLRGDVAGDIVDTYTHNWGDRVRETYESSMYSILK